MAVNEEKNENKKGGKMEKSYFEVVGMCCSSEVPLIEKILKSMDGVMEVTVIVPSRTVIVLHDSLLVSQIQIVKALNQARLEANVRVGGESNYKGKWPSPYVILSGILLCLSFLKYVYRPLEWLAIVAVAVGIWPITVRCLIAVRNFTLDANILMFIAVVGTIVLRDYTEAATIVFLFTISEWLGMRASHRATAVMSSLMSMAPQKATIAETGEVVNVEDVKLNTILAVKAGEIIPVDGIVVEGNCEVDEKALTGESFPVAKPKGATVRAGTVNVNGYVKVKTTALAEDSTVAKMAKLVEEAQNKKSSVQRLIDRCAKYYTPAVVLISAALAAFPAMLKLHDLRHWFHLALVVLVSACPCGLILSTPVATFCALSRAATSGLLIKGGDYLEILAKLKFIAFDKTGTLTRGEFTVEDFQSLADDVSLSNILYWVSSIESKSSHPIAAVLVEYARSKSIEPKPENIEDFRDFPGEGVSGKVDGKQIFVGNRKLGQRANCTATSNTGGDTNDVRTTGYIYSGGVQIGTFSLSDNCRAGAEDAIRDLKSLGIKSVLLTGDCQSAAMHAQDQLGHGLDVVHAELMPEDKAKIIQEYKNEGTTAMVGDGVNDAPALVTADIGISMGVSGTALANEASHVVLMSNDVRKIPKAIKLARRTRWKVMENIIFSIATKLGVLAFAIAGHPLVWLAVVADVVTCLIVILNSMLILRGKHEHGHKHGKKCHSHKSKCNASSIAKCSSQNCSTPCHTDKRVDSEHSEAHHSHDKPCSGHANPGCPADCHPSAHNSSSCDGNANSCDISEACDSACCTDEDHCLEMLESKSCCVNNARENEGTCCSDESCGLTQHVEESGCIQCHSNDSHNLSKLEHRVTINKPSCQMDQEEITPVDDVPHNETNNESRCHSHGVHHHVMKKHTHREQKTCCEGVAGNKSSCGKQGEITPMDIPHNQKKGLRCHSHGTHGHGSHHHAMSHGIHGHRSHHHAMSHGTCHGAGPKHACSSLRKREVRSCCRSYHCCGSSHGHFVPAFGGLTEIITE